MKTDSTRALPASGAMAPQTLVSITRAICAAGLAKLDECRQKCPGIGGDIDAANLRWMIERGEYHTSGMEQASRTLEGLAKGLEIEAAGEVWLLRNSDLVTGSPGLLDALLLFHSPTGNQIVSGDNRRRDEIAAEAISTVLGRP